MSARRLPMLLALACVAVVTTAQARDRVLRLPVADALAEPSARAIVGTLALRQIEGNTPSGASGRRFALPGRTAAIAAT